MKTPLDGGGRGREDFSLWKRIFEGKLERKGKGKRRAVAAALDEDKG